MGKKDRFLKKESLSKVHCAIVLCLAVAIYKSLPPPLCKIHLDLLFYHPDQKRSLAAWKVRSITKYHVLASTLFFYSHPSPLGNSDWTT